MSDSRFPGIKAKHAEITPICRFNRGLGDAFKEAAARLREEYSQLNMLETNKDATFHLILTVERPTSEPIDA